MTKLLAEQPLLVSLMLGAVAAGLIYGWLQTGKKATGVIGLVFLMLIPFAWVLASNWQTDREDIEALIYEIADAVEQNDHEVAVSVIADPQIQSRARSELQNWTFEMADVNSLSSIEMLQNAVPPEAEVDMSVKVRVSRNSGGIRNVQVPRRLQLRLQKLGGKWRVTEYRHMPLIGGPDPLGSSGQFGENSNRSSPTTN
ncbi:MAG: hypothetical protein ACR2NZ_24225 [Rubripirellula sp.]